MADDVSKTTIKIKSSVYLPAKEWAEKSGIDFQKLVELALARDMGKKMAILITEEGWVYGVVEEFAVRDLRATMDKINLMSKAAQKKAARPQ